MALRRLPTKDETITDDCTECLLSVLCIVPAVNHGKTILPEHQHILRVLSRLYSLMMCGYPLRIYTSL